MASERIKYLGNKLAKKVKDLYTEDYETKDLSKWKNNPYSWLEDTIWLRCRYYPEWSTDSMQPYQNPNGLLAEMEKPTLKFVWNYKGL